MFKVSVTNNKDGRQFGGMFETQALAQAWVDQQAALKSWGESEQDYSVEIKQDNSIKWAEVRAKRDSLLSETDWAMLPDAPISDAFKKKLVVYRQKLRDVPSANVDPNRVSWPTKPKG